MSIDKLSDEELAKIAMEPGRVNHGRKVPTKLDVAMKFCIENNIKHGDTAISAAVIYDMYLKWKKGSKLSQREFFAYFRRHFKRIVKKDGSYYKMNPSSFDLSEENLWRIRKRVREERQRRDRDKEVYEENVAQLRALSGAGKAPEPKNPPR